MKILKIKKKKYFKKGSLLASKGIVPTGSLYKKFLIQEEIQSLIFQVLVNYLRH